ncbi:MAG: nucleotidyltransferase substrate binding protein, partial [Anaerolineae bacterium]
DIRWRQRRQNFNKVLDYLAQALAIPQPDIVQRAGIIQLFEMAFELGWKMLKDYLEEQGFTGLNSPRAALKQAFEAELIANGHDWLQILRDRNLMSHIYDEATAVAVENLIRHTYYPLLHALRQTMTERDHA